MNADQSKIFLPALESAGYTSGLLQVTPLVPEASTRRYYRLSLRDQTQLIGVTEAVTTARANMPSVLAVQAFLKRGHIAVPEIYYSDPEAGIMLQQDLGDLSFNQLLKDHPDQTDQYYQDAIRHMFSWQRLLDDGHCPAFRLSFDVEKLMFEFDFFISHTLLGYYRAKIADAELSKIRSAFTKIAELLAAPERKVFTHRDYHSRNIMLVGASTALSQRETEDGHSDLAFKQYIIDFQDARMGLMQYDLCSLLCDAYAPLSVERRNPLLDFAFEEGKEIHCQTRAEFDHYWQLSAFQRTVKAMGTFGRQAAFGRDDFAAYLNPAWRMLKEITAQSREMRQLADQLAGVVA